MSWYLSELLPQLTGDLGESLVTDLLNADQTNDAGILAQRERVKLRGPFCEAMPVQHLAWDPARGALLAAAGSPWYGALVWRSEDLGETWTQSGAGLTYGDADGTPVGSAVEQTMAGMIARQSLAFAVDNQVKVEGEDARKEDRKKDPTEG